MTPEQQKGNSDAKRPRGRPPKNSSHNIEKRNQEIGVLKEGEDMIFDRIGKKKEVAQEPIRAPIQNVGVGGRVNDVPGLPRPQPPWGTGVETSLPVQASSQSTPVPPRQEQVQQPAPPKEELHPYHKEFIEKYQGSFNPMEFPHTAVGLDLQWATYSVLCDCRWMLTLLVEEVRKR